MLESCVEGEEGGSWQLSLAAGQLLKCCQPARQQQLKLDSQPHLRAVQNSRTFLTLFVFSFSLVLFEQTWDGPFFDLLTPN